MTQLYFFLNALTYLIFAVWCLLKPAGTANFLGLDFLSAGGKTEYLTVYAGMEFGFAVFYALCGFYPALRPAGLLFSVCMYSGIILVRISCILLIGNPTKATFMAGALECVFGIWALLLLLSKPDVTV